METFIIIGAIGLVALVVILTIQSQPPKWKQAYFRTIIEVNHGTSDEEIGEMLLKRYKIENPFFAIEAAKFGNEDWFKQNIK